MAQPLRKKNTQNDPNIDGQITQVIYNVGGATPIMNSTFVTLSPDTNLTNERILTAGSAMTLTDNGPGNSIVFNLDDTAVTPGTYSLATLSVDQKGRVTAASSGSAPATQTTLFNETGSNANLIFIGSKLLADAARRFSATVSGDLSWGDGTAAKVRLNYASGAILQIVDPSNNPADLTLSTLRGNAAIFSTPNTFNVSFETRTAGDANPRFQVVGEGKIGLGGGSSGMDTYLWRSGNAELTLGSSPTTADGTLVATSIKATGDLTIDPAGGDVSFAGNNLIDCYRIDALNIAGNDTTYRTNMAGDAQWRLLITANGTLRFGNGTSASVGSISCLQSSASGDALVLSNQSTQNGMGTLQLKNLTTVVGEDLVLNPDGAVDMSNNLIKNVSQLNLTAAGTTIVRGVTNGTMEITDGGFNPGTLKVSNILTTTGDLFLNPAGSNIDCSGKNLVNVVLPTVPITFPITNSGSATRNTTIASRYSANSFDKFTLTNDGVLGWGNGLGAQTAFLSYGGVNGQLILTETFGGSSSSSDFQVGTITLTNSGTTRLRSDTNGVVQVRNSSGTAGSGQVNCGTVNGEGGGSLNLDADSGSILCNNNLLGDMRVLDVCGTLTNTINSAADRSIVAGAGNTLGSNADDSAIISSGSTSITSTGGRNTILGCTGGSSISAGAGSLIMGSSGGTISSSGNYNMIMNSRLGGTTISGSATGVTLVGSNISTSFSNVFGLSDSSATAVSVGSANTFYTRFNGNHYFTSNAAGTLGVQMNSGGTSWTTVSDARLKDIHCEIDGTSVLNKIDELSVIKYKYKCDETEGRCEARIGMIAQEVNGLYGELGLGKHFDTLHPESTEEDPIQRVCGDEIAYLAMACIKELKKENKELREGLRKTMEVVKGLSNRLKAAEAKLALAGTSVGTFEKM